MGGVVSGDKGPAIPSLLQDKEAGKAKVNISFIKIIASLNKVMEEIKALREIMRAFTRSL